MESECGRGRPVLYGSVSDRIVARDGTMMAITVHPALVYFYVHTIFVTRGAAWKEESEEEEKKNIRGRIKEKRDRRRRMLSFAYPRPRFILYWCTGARRTPPLVSPLITVMGNERLTFPLIDTHIRAHTRVIVLVYCIPLSGLMVPGPRFGRANSALCDRKGLTMRPEA